MRDFTQPPEPACLNGRKAGAGSPKNRNQPF
jgi:hypothetical protein